MMIVCKKAPRRFTALPKLVLSLLVFGMLIAGNWRVRGSGTNALNYWVAPTAEFAGDGSSSSSAASYLNPTFWNGVQSQLNNTNVTVNFVTGAYNGGTLSMTNMGNPVHLLTLAAVTPYGPVFSPSANILQLYGCQNYQLNGLVFNGPTQKLPLRTDVSHGLSICFNANVPARIKIVRYEPRANTSISGFPARAQIGRWICSSPSDRISRARV